MYNSYSRKRKRGDLFMSTDLRSTTYSLGHNISNKKSEHFLIHSHPFYELWYFLSGDVHFLYAGVEYVMQPHTLIIVAPNVFHGIRVLSTETYERFTFHFTEDIISMNHRQLLMGSLPTEETIRDGTSPIPCIISNAESLGFLPLMLDAERVIGMPQDVCDTMASVILEALLSILLIHVGDLRFSARIPSYYSEYQELKPVLSYIHQNLTEKMTLDDLSGYAHISKSKLNHLFRTQLGATVMEYVTRRRLIYAQQLLFNGYPAAQASTAAGFGDYTNFYRAYMKQMGHSPIDDKRTINENGDPLPLRAAAMGLVQEEGVRIDDDKPSIWSLHKVTVINERPGVLVEP